MACTVGITSVWSVSVESKKPGAGVVGVLGETGGAVEDVERDWMDTSIVLSPAEPVFKRYSVFRTVTPD